jgi:hypothetical protein
MQHKIDIVDEEDRRRFPRHKLKEGSFAFFGSTPGVIVDISPAGMSVNYIVLDEKKYDQITFDLFSPKNKIYLPSLHGKVVREDRPDPAPSYSTLHTRKLCIMFEELSNTQLSKLNQFISENKKEQPGSSFSS